MLFAPLEPLAFVSLRSWHGRSSAISNLDNANCLPAVFSLFSLRESLGSDFDPLLLRLLPSLTADQVDKLTDDQRRGMTHFLRSLTPSREFPWHPRPDAPLRPRRNGAGGTEWRGKVCGPGLPGNPASPRDAKAGARCDAGFFRFR